MAFEGKKQRLDFIDLMKGICIILVLLKHCHMPYFTNSPALSTLRMPLYFILSGIFFKQYESIFEFGIKKINSLIIPFLCAWVMYNLVIFGYQTYLHQPYHVILFPRTIWFLLCLFEVGVMYYFVRLLNNFVLETIACIAISLTGYILYCHHIELPLFFSSSLTSILFYHYGFSLKKLNVLNNSDSKINVLLFFLFGAIFTTLSLTMPLGIVNIKLNQFPGNFFIIQLVALSGTLCLFYFAKIFQRLPVISFYGRYSIIILCFHIVYLFYLDLIIAKFTDDEVVISIVSFVSLLVLMYPTIKLVLKYVPFLFAQQTLISYQAVNKRLLYLFAK